MAHDTLLEEQRVETRLIIQELLDDGSDPDVLYTLEHHFSCNDTQSLEKAASEFFKLGYDVTEAEEMPLDDGSIVMCIDVLTEVILNAELIDAQVEQLVTIAAKYNVEYDGWGTWFEDPEETEDDKAYLDNDDTGIRH